MGLEQIIPAIFLIAVLVLVLPSFLRSNNKSKQFFKNLNINYRNNVNVIYNSVSSIKRFNTKKKNIIIFADPYHCSTSQSIK